MAVEIANEHIGIAIVQGIWVIKLELSSWWFVDRSDSDTADVDGEYLNVVNIEARHAQPIGYIRPS